MLVSIVITNFNYADFLADAIESALNQSYQPIEVIVVDDGSTDGSRAIIESYEGQLHPIFKENAGQLSSVNLGFSRSRGDAIIFLDSDDVLYGDAVERHVGNLSLSGVVKSQGYLEVADRCLKPSGAVIPLMQLSESGDYKKRFFKYGPSAYRATFTSGHAWSRAFLEAVMPLPEEQAGLVGPDGYLTAIDALFGRIESVEGPLGKYRIHGGNAGPQGYRCTNEYFKARVQGYLHRINFAAAKARKMGYQVDPDVWLRHTGWKLMLARHILYRNGELPDRVPFWRIVLSPLREANANFLMGLLRSLMLAAVRLAPSEIGLRLGHRMLDKSWGRALVPVSIPTERIQD